MKLDERRILEEAGLIYPDNAVERAVLCKAIGTYGVDAQCDQLCIMFGIEIRAQRHRTEKLERLQIRLETE